jgi:hypothetical protein
LMAWAERAGAEKAETGRAGAEPGARGLEFLLAGTGRV